MRSRGYAFVNVNPRVVPDRQNHTVTLIFDVGEGPRVYIERINIIGNTRTEDKVIRREFTLAEGDPFSAEAIRRTRQRLQRPAAISARWTSRPRRVRRPTRPSSPRR